MQAGARAVYGAVVSELAPLVAFEAVGWNGPWPESAADALEQGGLVHFPHLRFEPLLEERRLLHSAWPMRRSKNISLDPATGTLGGVEIPEPVRRSLSEMMARFSGLARGLVLGIAPSYGAHLRVGRTSFRPVEIEGRPSSSWRSDDTRLHTDAFPATPTGGARILRVFANIDPEDRPRLWRTGQNFERIAARYVPRVRPPLPGSAAVLHWLGITRGLRSPYDHYMLRLHDMAKADGEYQRSSPRREIAFLPSVWLVFTDQVPHAALAGRNALEQTFYLPVRAQRHPELAPLSILERLTRRKLAAS
jgi:hypothetical protein